MLGRTISHYRVVSQLGAGGMGVVYAAEDIRLGRPVALKFVPEELAADPHALERFRVEARAASALNHPNICTIYDIGDDAGRPFIVMELLQGQTLRDRLSAGPMKIHQIVDAGIHIADALDAAHSHGIVHRDIKPANLFLLDRGQVKIMDFGLAKLAADSDGATTTGAARLADQLTAPGVTLGTVSYMSPEQAAGEDLDGRTDLFSVGVVLYECATGHRPFNGNSAGVILAAILNKSPVAPTIFNPDLPLRLQEVINNCLEKDRDLRYQTAADLRADLRRVKRDLESGRLLAADTDGRQRSAGVGSRSGMPTDSRPEAPSAPSAAPGATPAPIASAPASGARIEASRDVPPASGSSPSQGLPATSHATPPKARWVAAVAAAVTVLVMGTLYFALWRRGGIGTHDAGQPTVADSRSAATVDLRSQVDAAKRNLDAGNPRAALSRAEDVLQVSPADREAARVRDEARARLQQFDAAMADARRLLRSGDPGGATRALERARAIDPIGPGLVELSGQVADLFHSEAERARQELQRSRTEASAPPVTRTPADARSSSRPAAPLPSKPGSGPGAAPSIAPSTVGPPPGSTGAAPSNPPAPGTSPTAPAPAPASATPPQKPAEDPTPAKPHEETPPGSPSPPTTAPAAQRTPSEPAKTGAPLPSTSREDRREPEKTSPAPSAGDDESAIKRVLATYARAIETKDLALFRSVKPNLTAGEEQRIEAGFRAVASQRVAISVDSIERQGTLAVVRLRRRDTIDAGGKRQTAESQQTVRLSRTDAGNWVIVEIGR